LSHTCVDDAPDGMPADSMTINLKLLDEEGAFTTSTAVIKVNNVAPTVAIGSDRSALVGESLNFGAVITDPGVGDTHTVSWDFGDGSLGASGVYVDHTFDQPGRYFVCATVEDDDGGIGRAMIKVEVRVLNYLPMITR
jgi:PKD repeat protein